MKLFSENIGGKREVHVDFPEEVMYRNLATISIEVASPSIQTTIKEIFENKEESIFSLPNCFDNPNEIIDEIYITLYGKPIGEMYKNMGSWKNRDTTGALPWSKERVLNMNWNLFLASIYTFYISSDNCVCDSWENISKILNLLKNFKTDEWKHILFGKSTDVLKSVEVFWKGIETIICKKYLKLIKVNINYASNIEEMKEFIDEYNYLELQKQAYNEFVVQLDREFQRLSSIQNNFSECIKQFYSGLKSVTNYISFYTDEKILTELKTYIADSFVHLGDICYSNQMFELSNEIYVTALLFATTVSQEKEIRLRNRKVCKYIPRNIRVSIKGEKHHYLRMHNNEYNNKIQKVKEVAERILIPSVVIFAIAMLVFLILMIIGLIVSKGLFSFSWKALLASLGLTILSFVSLYYTTEKL